MIFALIVWFRRLLLVSTWVTMLCAWFSLTYPECSQRVAVCTRLLLQTTKKNVPVLSSQTLWCGASPSMVDATFSLLSFWVLTQRTASCRLSHGQQWKPCSSLHCLTTLLPPFLQTHGKCFRVTWGELIKQISRVHPPVASGEKSASFSSQISAILLFSLSSRLCWCHHFISWPHQLADQLFFLLRPTGPPTARHSKFVTICGIIYTVGSPWCVFVCLHFYLINPNWCANGCFRLLVVRHTAGSFSKQKSLYPTLL